MIFYIDKKQHNVTADIVGGKGYSLLEMYNNNIPVPGGIIISTDVYDGFVRNDFIEKKFAELEKSDVDAKSVLDAIRMYIQKTDFAESFIKDVVVKINEYNSTFFSVRSSANLEDSKMKSFAGEFESFLFVSKDNILKYIKECYMSVFTERILSYLDKPSDIKNIKMAVVVQIMINSDVSGVCFTANPLDFEEDDIVIEAVHGLGEYLMQGSVTPDKYIVHRKTHIPLEVEFHKQPKMMNSMKRGGIKVVRNNKSLVQKLNGLQMVQLAQMAEKIEKINGTPGDIEWAYANGELYILQSRPIVFTI
jgi:pyruvate,water dikinase